MQSGQVASVFPNPASPTPPKRAKKIKGAETPATITQHRGAAAITAPGSRAPRLLQHHPRAHRAGPWPAPQTREQKQRHTAGASTELLWEARLIPGKLGSRRDFWRFPGQPPGSELGLRETRAGQILQGRPGLGLGLSSSSTVLVPEVCWKGTTVATAAETHPFAEAVDETKTF